MRILYTNKEKCVPVNVLETRRDKKICFNDMRKLKLMKCVKRAKERGEKHVKFPYPFVSPNITIQKYKRVPKFTDINIP